MSESESESLDSHFFLKTHSHTRSSCLAVVQYCGLKFTECLTYTELCALSTAPYNEFFCKDATKESSLWWHRLTSCNIPGDDPPLYFSYQKTVQLFGDILLNFNYYYSGTQLFSLFSVSTLYD